ncbi:MAG: hypothetical protein ACP5NS_03355 [Candidatus Pacearchaeota archaeon]
MGIFTNLIHKVSEGARQVGYALGVVECLDAKKPIPFRGSANFKGKNRWTVLDEMHTGFRETEKALDELVALPGDNLEPFEVSSYKISYRPTLDEFARAKDILNERKARNFASYLESTLADFERQAWNTDIVYTLQGDKAIGSKLTRANVNSTLDYYARKLGSVTSDVKYNSLIERATAITGSKYSLASK